MDWLLWISGAMVTEIKDGKMAKLTSCKIIKEVMSTDISCEMLYLKLIT
jgi:hypothetical protein